MEVESSATYTKTEEESNSMQHSGHTERKKAKWLLSTVRPLSNLRRRHQWKDLQGVVTDGTPARKRIRYVASEMIGRSTALLIPPDRRDEEGRFLVR